MNWDTEKEDYCEGEIELARYNLAPEIRWKCKDCENNGVIVNFEGTPWDLSDMPKQEAQQYLDDKYSFGLFPGLDFGQDFESVASFGESMEDAKEWLANLSDKELQDFQKTMEAEAKKMGLDLNDFDGGLLPDEREQLLFSNWTDPKSPIYLRNDLPLETLNDIEFFHNARILLTEIAKNDGFELTKTQENLQRKHVEDLVEKFIWPDGFIENVKQFNKVIDEQDVWPLHTLRVLLDIAGLIRKHKGKFVLVQKQVHLLKKEHTGKLYQKLFSAFFKQMNIAYLTDGEPIPYQQESIPYILFRMQFMGDDWCPIAEVMENVLLDDARFELYSTLNPYSSPVNQFYRNVLIPLEKWGLIEVHGSSESRFNFEPKVARKTPFFDVFLEFNGVFRL